MRKILTIVFLGFILLSCDSENAPNCIQTAGPLISKKVEVAPFSEIIVYERVKLFIKQGPEQKVRIETGENLLNDVSVKVQNNRLSIYNENSCNLVRNYEVTKVYVTTPSLSWLQNSSGSSIESINTLKFPKLWLRSVNQEEDPDIHTDGDFKLSLDVDSLRITNDNLSNYFLNGKVNFFNVFIAAGDARLEAENLEVQRYNIFHRGTNTLTINPIQYLKADLYSSGNIISKNRPPEVRETQRYTGKLIFE